MAGRRRPSRVTWIRNSASMPPRAIKRVHLDALQVTGVPLTASELEEAWRDAVRAAELAERLTTAAAAAVEDAQANVVAATEVSRLADEAAAAAIRAAMSAKAAHRRAVDGELV